MNRMKTIFAAVAILLFFTANANADYNSYCYDPCETDCCECGSIYLGVDFLYWKPCVDDLHYALKSDSAIITNANGFNDYKIHLVDPSWEPGVRLTLGKTGCWNGAGLRTSWTYFNPTQSASVSSTVGNTIVLTNAPDVILDFTGEKASSHWKMDYNQWDLLVTYPVSWGIGCDEVIPFFGVEGVSIRQDKKDSLYDVIVGDDFLKTHRKTDYWGVGPKVGVELDYHICSNFRFWGLISGGILAGDLDSKDVFEKGLNNESETTNPIAQLKYSSCECLIVGHSHIAFGFLYDFCVCDRDIGLKIGYEFQRWANTPSFRNYAGDSSDTDRGLVTSVNRSGLGFHGLTAGLAFEF